jgi:dephospho-CoA kinase
MKIIGLTGGIAAGKSTASAIICEMGIPVICADTIAHAVMEPGAKAYKAIVKIFGKKILDADKSINRKTLGRLVFADPVLIKKLNSLVHPFVIEETKKQINAFKKTNTAVVLDVPLLFETHLDKLCDKTILIAAPTKVTLQRITKRDGLTRKEALDRINSQMTLEEKKKRADFVIENTGTKAALKKKIQLLLPRITSRIFRSRI